MYIFFLISVQYCVMRFCTGVLGITLIITNTRKLFDIMSRSSGGHFGVFWGLFSHIISTFWEPFNKFYAILYTCSWCSYPLRITALFFPISWPSWRALGGIFGLILWNFPLIFQKQSMFSHELCTCILGIILMVTTLETVFYIMFFISRGPFLGVLGLIFAYLSLFLENCSILFLGVL